MRSLRHTIGCRIAGYESLEVTIDIGLTDEQINRAQTRGVHSFVLDFPNWDAVAESLEMVEDDPETGEPSATVMAKPALPLTHKALGRLPTVLQTYIANGYVIFDANQDYLETVRPKLSKTWGTTSGT